MNLIHGDCIEKMAELPDNSVDSIVTDPPYELGFMGKHWDGTGIAYNVETWRQALRVLKPGGHLLAFSGSRTYHRMVCAIEDAGFEIRDQIMWLYGSGFPKSHNLGTGWGTALKPAHEPIVLARKPLSGTVAANVLKHGTGAINVDGCRVETADDLNGGTYSNGAAELSRASQVPGNGIGRAFVQPPGRWPANVIHDGSDEVVGAFPESAGQQGDVRGTEPSKLTNGIYGDFAGRPPQAKRGDSGSAARFYYVAKAGRAERLKHLACNCETVKLCLWEKQGRSHPGQMDGISPQRVTSESQLDGGSSCSTSIIGSKSAGQSPPDTLSTTSTETSRITVSTTSSLLPQPNTSASTQDVNCETVSGGNPVVYAGTNFASMRGTFICPPKDGRFTGVVVDATSPLSSEMKNCAACGSEVKATGHPTQKPETLMRYLCRLITPPGRTILDPFMGSGSTGRGAVLEGFGFIGIEREAEYLAIAERRIAEAAPRLGLPVEPLEPDLFSLQAAE